VKKRAQSSPNRHLRRQREQIQWTQKELARMVGTTYVNVSRWENGITSPSLYYRKKICELFHKSPEELGFTDPSEQVDAAGKILPVSPSLFSVPYRRNLFFTGRETVLAHIYDILHSDKEVSFTQAQAISGLAGIGKTQTIVEYAYRYRDEYAAIFWVRAETPDALAADFVTIADTLDIPEKKEQEQQHIIEAVKRWFNSNKDWLLILDNVEDFSLVNNCLPSCDTGHILLTMRAQSTGTIAHCINLEKMPVGEAALFLLRRAKLLRFTDTLEEATTQERVDAETISQHLDGLPLALDQAGAYIEESQCSLSDYLDRYQSRRALLLDLRGSVGLDHPQSVTATLSLSFEKVEQINPAATELLNLCAFLHPDAIAEEMLFEGASELDSTLKALVTDAFKLDAAVTVVRHYSLLSRQPHAKMFTIHRIVQAVLKDRMSEQTQRQWAERAVKVVSRVFPGIKEVDAWSRCQHYLPHAQVCATLIEQWELVSSEATRLLKETGLFYMKNGQYVQAEVALHRVQDIQTQIVGPAHPDVAEMFLRLGELSFFQGRYEQAEAYARQAWSLYEKGAGFHHENAAACLNDLAVIYHAQSKYMQAEPLYMQALSIRKEILGPLHPDSAESLNNLAFFYYQQGAYSRAEPLYQQALKIYEQVCGQESYETARGLNNLAMLYYRQEQYEKVEPLHLRALAIHENILGPAHPHVAFSLSNLAMLYHVQKRHEEVEPLHLRALAIREKSLGPEHPDVATSLNNLALHSFEVGQHDQAEHLYQRAVSILEKTLGPQHPRTAQSLHDLANLYTFQGKYEQAESLYQKVLSIREEKLGSHHPDVAETLEKYALLLLAVERKSEAAELSVRAEEIHKKRRNK
jgi:tetratricopeptide (TPR) repeat protein/DNA-binding XRE family transcriptional regulator